MTPRPRGRGVVRWLASGFYAAACLAAVVLVVGCGDDDDSPTPDPAPPETPQPESDPLDLESLFPIAAGNRWRYQFEGGVAHNWGITSVTDDGVAVTFGTASALAERYTVSAEELALVAPNGQPLAVILRAPLEEGATFDYVRPDDAGDVECAATIDRIGEWQHGDLNFAPCVTATHECASFEIEETHCATIGRVERTVRIRAPDDRTRVAETSRERLVAYRVAGSPVQSLEGISDCRSLIVLPADINAACGPAMEPGGEPHGVDVDGRCRYRYIRNGETIEIAVAGEEPPPDNARVVTSGDRSVVLFAPEQACAAQSLRRLSPLVESLIGSY